LSHAPLSVAVVGINYAPEETGIGPYTAALARGLRDRGHEVRVVTTFPHYPAWRVAEGYEGRRMSETLDGVHVTRHRHYVPDKPVGLRRAWSEVTFGLAAARAQIAHVDVVIAPSPAMLSNSLLTAALRLRRRPPAVGVIVQDLYSAGMLENHDSPGHAARVMRRLEARMLGRADGVAVIHDRFKQRVVADLGVPEDRVDVIRNWTHVDRPAEVDRAAARARWGWGDDELVVLHTGAMGEKQGLENVVATARLAQIAQPKVRFVLMGDGGRRAELQDSAEGVSTIDFIPPVSVEDYPIALRAADVLLVNERPGLQEMAVPSKLTSYFSSGHPVVAATESTSTTADEIRAAGAGVVVPPGRPADLLASIVDLGGDPHRRETLGAAGPAYCDKVLSEEAALDAYDAWVRRLAERRNPRGKTK